MNVEHPRHMPLLPPTHRPRRWSDGFAVEGIQWRRFVDWAVLNLPAAVHPVLIWLGTLVFFFVAAPARRSVSRQLAVILPGSGRIRNFLRTFCVFANFGWMLTDSALHRLRKVPFVFELEGNKFLEQLAAADGAIVLTAHMGNYDLGAAMFAKKFNRELRMVRASERDVITAEHMSVALHQSGSVKVDYSDNGTALVFDLCNALRNREIISIQGDRVVGELARASVRLFGRNVLLPTGPFVLSLVTQAPIFPLFITRIGHRKYKVAAYDAIVVTRSDELRDEKIARAMAQWSGVLETVVRRNWSQWYAFKPVL